MRAPPQLSHPRSDGGFALVATLAVLTLLSAVSLVVFGSTMAAYKVGVTDLEKSRTYYAAEGASDYAMAQIGLALADGALLDEELNSLNAPTISGFSIDTFSAVKNGVPTVERITDGTFAGLGAVTQLVDITAEASSPDGTTSEILLTAKAQSIPIFQFGVFFEKDLEIHPGGTMEFGGWIHTNGNLYLSGAALFFEDLLTTPNNVFWDRKDKHEVKTGVTIHDAGGNDVPLNFDSRDTPDPNAFRAKSDASFDNRLMTNAYGVDSLKVPLPDGLEPIEVLMPRDESDPQIARDSKMAWKADWYIEVDLSQIVWHRKVDRRVGVCAGAMTSTRDGGQGVPTESECENIFTYTTDGWFDPREYRFVDVLDIDVGQLQSWGTGANAVSVLYVTMDPTGAPDSNGDGVFPVVRLKNGSSLTTPLSIATDLPMYVQGDYNNVGWQPAAIMGDAVNVLSNAWDDATHQVVTVSEPGGLPRVGTQGAETTVYAAILAAHTGTPCDHEVPGCGTRVAYGGGLENFFRYQEVWQSKLIFRGSIVSVGFTQKALGRWRNWYYSAPGRDFGYDSRLDLIENMPPGTPHVGNVVHTAFRPVLN